MTLTDAAASCPALPAVGPDLIMDGFYRLDDPTHSIVDPVRMKAYTEAAKPAKSAALQIVTEADEYRDTGSRDAARCTLGYIASLAAQHAMTGRMSSAQSYYVQGWLAGAIAVAYLKVRDSGLQTSSQQQVIIPWLRTLGQATRDWYDQAAQRKTQGNNHLYWAGMELAAIAAATNEPNDLEWAYAAYRNGIAQIQPDGTLPLEMARGSKALHYHLYALAPLVMIGEFGQANGTDLFAERDGALRKLAAATIAQTQDPSLFQRRTGVAQENAHPLSGDQIGWAPPVAARFQLPGLTTLIAQAPSLRVFYLGGEPPR
ncbi:alginate lyase family protein [Terriglobus aquaticus]|uniref:Alginate lyase family protein n=1 Tax=Terriglobus aquaticus TaxID=940139 RepID=A0ABW9KMD8_9BACT|nr:alginate lyase family protein [Terriglobus aquaticus]